MSIIENVFYDALVIKNAQNSDEVITYLANYLQEKNYVNEKYCKATLDRERLYPTGLATKPIGIAVPHSNSENVLKQAIIVATINPMVTFTEMGSESSKTEVGVVIMLALKGEDSHLNYLKNIVNFFKIEENVSFFYNLNEKEKICTVFKDDVLKIND